MSGYFEREPELLRNRLEEKVNNLDYSEFIEAIKYLALKNKKFNIILRPHPVENVETWKICQITFKMLVLLGMVFQHG